MNDYEVLGRVIVIFVIYLAIGFFLIPISAVTNVAVRSKKRGTYFLMLLIWPFLLPFAIVTLYVIGLYEIFSADRTISFEEEILRERNKKLHS